MGTNGKSRREELDARLAGVRLIPPGAFPATEGERSLALTYPRWGSPEDG